MLDRLRLPPRLEPLRRALPFLAVVSAIPLGYPAITHFLRFGDRSTYGYSFAEMMAPAWVAIAPAIVASTAVLAYRFGRIAKDTAHAAVLGFAASILAAGLQNELFGRFNGSAFMVLLVLLAVHFASVRRAVLGRSVAAKPGRTERAATDEHGHADFMPMDQARALFGAGGVVVGEAYRVDQDAKAFATMEGHRILVQFDPKDRATWAGGGKAPLLRYNADTSTTHGLVFAGSGAYKTTGYVVPTMLLWDAPAVVLDPSREICPMVRRHRESLGRAVHALDSQSADTAAFNVLDWIDPAAVTAEEDIAAVVGWIAGELRPETVGKARDFFGPSAEMLINCVLSHMMFDPSLPADRKTLRTLHGLLSIPESELRKFLAEIATGSASASARAAAAKLAELVPETFSGIVGNTALLMRFLDNPHYAAMVSGSDFRTADLCDGRADVFLNLSLNTLERFPALARVIVGALLNAVYRMDGNMGGRRVLFCLDEIARLKYMALLDTARDVGRKYGITLLLFYQSVGQLVQQFGPEGKSAWYASTAWRAYSSLKDPDTLKEVSELLGEHGAVTRQQSAASGSNAHFTGFPSGINQQESESASIIKRQLMKRNELFADTRDDEQIVFVGGYAPLRCSKAIYFRRPELVALVDENRFAPAAAAGGAP
ncbi:MAG TPA: type IV secretory system conjugative DNA transfer family protein [Azospirillum sp.]|nr:type IV secretory system conjugative DNA transfer family protein [Azospirillum sp.]